MPAAPGRGELGRSDADHQDRFRGLQPFLRAHSRIAQGMPRQEPGLVCVIEKRQQRLLEILQGVLASTLGEHDPSGCLILRPGGRQEVPVGEPGHQRLDQLQTVKRLTPSHLLTQVRPLPTDDLEPPLDRRLGVRGGKSDYR